MKKTIKVLIFAALLITIGASFFIGRHTKQQEYLDNRLQNCHTLISFAIDKVENQDISDPDIMEALISNVYAAYQFCDQPHLSEQLYDLWNTLIFDGNSYIGQEDMLVAQLRNIAETISSEN